MRSDKMNIEEFQAQFDKIIMEMRRCVDSYGDYWYDLFDNSTEELYNLCLKALELNKE